MAAELLPQQPQQQRRSRGGRRSSSRHRESSDDNNHNSNYIPPNLDSSGGGGGGGAGGEGFPPISSSHQHQHRHHHRHHHHEQQQQPEQPPRNTATASSDQAPGFVTSPPKQRAGLTGSISTLFRRGSPRDHAHQQHQHHSSYHHTNRVSAEKQKQQQHRHRQHPPQHSRSNLTESSRASSILSSGAETTSTAGDYDVSPVHRVPTTHRVFYNDDSDDSYESRVSQALSTATEEQRRRSRRHSKTKKKPNNSKSRSVPVVGESDVDETDYEDEDQSTFPDAATTATTYTTTPKTILRYRGFSTSVKSLFLDESLVCASMGCFGLILSNRTEYLLQLRNQTRGKQFQMLEGTASSSARKSRRNVMHSRVVAYALVVTLFLIGLTFVIWGFGNSSHGGAWNALRNNRNKNNDNGDSSSSSATTATDDQYASSAYDNYQNNLNNRYNYNNNNNNGGGGGGYDYYHNNNNYNNNNNNQGNNNQNNNNNNNQGNNNQNNNNNNQGNNNQNNDNNNKNAQDEDVENGEENGADGDTEEVDNGDVEEGEEDGNNRARQLDTRVRYMPRHRFLGITKLRDFSEHLWDPLVDSLIRDNSDWWYGSESEKREVQFSDRFLENSSGSSSGSSKKSNNWAADIRGGLVCLFLLFLGILGRRRRMRTRYAIAKARAQEDHLFYASTKIGEVDPKSLSKARKARDGTAKEDHYEGACLHTLCGCYPVDPPMDEEEEQYYIAAEEEEESPVADGIFKTRKRRRHEDCVSRCFNCFLSSCCGVMCKCWFQCLSICALAQEAREIRLLLPPRFQRVDFITHQPFHEYQKDVNDLRRGWLGKTRRKAGILPHIQALSRLSRYIVGIFTFSVVVIILTLMFNPRASFTWPDVIVLLATFVQAFLVIYIVHGIFHKSDLSLDAVIKFFAAGFVIAVPAALLFETMLWSIITASAWFGYTIMDWIKGEEFELWMYNHYSYFWIVGELIQAYIVAAVIEELCKYYTFRAVEHPDLIFLTGLDRQAQDETAVDGGLVKYPYGSHQVSNLNRVQSFGSASEHSRKSHGSSYRRGRSRDSDDDDTFQGIHKTTTEEEFYEDEHDARTYRQKAAAVTTGMISLAVGLACAENFLYVFLAGGGDSGNDGDDQKHDDTLLQEWMILFFRSIFPVHALSAAMQSINVIRKFVECTDDHNHRIGVGRIILPAVLMHGTFDAILMLMTVYVEVAREKWLRESNGNAEGRPYNPLVVNLIAWVSVTSLMIFGLVWYYQANRSQKLRLKIVEAREEGEEEIPYTSPTMSPARTTLSEIELL